MEFVKLYHITHKYNFGDMCFPFYPPTERRTPRDIMRSAAKPWSPVAKAGSHGPDRTRPLPGTPSGMKSSKSSTSLAFESRLSKVQTFRAGL
jgi:hypothetical protein